MKYLLKIISRYGINIFILHGLVYTQTYKYGVFTSPPELENVFVDENEETYALVLEFSGANFDYVTNESFAPPSLSLFFKNVIWDKGNFVKKCNQKPLYLSLIHI